MLDYYYVSSVYVHVCTCWFTPMHAVCAHTKGCAVCKECLTGIVCLSQRWAEWLNGSRRLWVRCTSPRRSSKGGFAHRSLQPREGPGAVWSPAPATAVCPLSVHRGRVQVTARSQRERERELVNLVSNPHHTTESPMQGKESSHMYVHLLLPVSSCPITYPTILHSFAAAP